MAEQCGETPAETASTPECVLAFLTGLLGTSATDYSVNGADVSAQDQKNTEMWSSIPWQSSTAAIPDSEEEIDPDFSSFPSLSLERSPHEQFGEDLDRRESIQTHVASLLARPILVSNTGKSRDELEDGDYNESDTMEFIAEDFSKVPELMLHNFFASFSTLMNSRLRAYAAFLARHGLSLFECSETAQELDEGITGVEQKLETMLEIGRLVSSHSVETSFQAKPDEATYSPQDDGEQQVSLPLKMEASIVILLPHPVGGQNGLVTVSFVANGSVAGIFGNNSKHPQLRVVQVDLNMSELLPSMIEQASCVISRIVEMTNTVYSLALPRYEDSEANANRLEVPASPEHAEDESKVREGPLPGEKRNFHVVSPTPVPAVASTSRTISSCTLDKNESMLSAEKCENLVDYLFEDMNSKVMDSRVAKKARFPSSDEFTTGS